MAINVNQQDFNQSSSSTLQSVFKFLGVVIYETTKAVAAFIGSMNKMFWGK